MREKFIIILFNLISTFLTVPMENKNDREFNLLFSTGVDYNFLGSTNPNYKEKFLFLKLPINTELEIKLKKEFSLGWGINFSYGIVTYQREIEEKLYKYYFHNFFINLPFHVKFYPLVNISQIYERFYLGSSLFIHFWVLNYYWIQNIENNQAIYGNSYTSFVKQIPPPGVYTPINLGIMLRIGNQFKISERKLIGIELYGSYLLLPVINGYYKGINYKEEDVVILEFVPSIGVSVSLGVILF